MRVDVLTLHGVSDTGLAPSDESVEQIAARGYTEGVTLRTLLRRRLGPGVKQIRGNL